MTHTGRTWRSTIQIRKAKPGDLEPLLASHSGVSGDIWYVLVCKYCTDNHSITVKGASKQSKDARSDVALKFQAVGWRMDGSIPVCPRCYKRKVKSGLYLDD